MSGGEVEALAEEAGLTPTWRDAAGEPQTVSAENLRRLLGHLGFPAETAADIAESRRRLRESAASAPLITADVGKPIPAPPGLRGRTARLTLADGETRDVPLRGDVGESALPPIDRPGYHRLQLDDAEITLAVAPRHAFAPSDAAAGKLWGVGVQIYALRDDGAADFGDFGALARFAESAGNVGAGLIAVSPTHALFTADASRFSPYAPSTRLFLNPVYADPRAIFPDEAPPATGDQPELVDWAKAWPARIARLAAVHRRFQEQGGSNLHGDLAAFRERGGSDLEGHAVFEALHQHFFSRQGARGWPDWPQAYQDHNSEAVAAFAREHAGEVDFHVFLQWLADRSLGAAQAAAKGAGMPIGLVADLAVGMDAGGSHAWSRPHDLLRDVDVGAPPDLWAPSGQNWGITAFSPTGLRASGYAAFRATIRAAVRHAGGVRIDHAMGLRRLWLVPRGASPAEGAYLAYPFDDLVRLLTLESWLNRAVVVAEDLGTVPAGFREALQAHRMMGMQVLWFERLAGGGFRAPRGWSRASAALTTTHDLPTVAGWWTGRDIEWAEQLGRKSAYDSPEHARSERAKERRRLWTACRRAGVAEGEPPAAGEPAAAVDAALGFVAQTPCPVAIVPAEDLAGLVEQPNLPGTIDEHPNWRRRLPPTDELLGAAPVRARLAILNQSRPR